MLVLNDLATPEPFVEDDADVAVLVHREDALCAASPSRPSKAPAEPSSYWPIIAE